MRKKVARSPKSSGEAKAKSPGAHLATSKRVTRTRVCAATVEAKKPRESKMVPVCENLAVSEAEKALERRSSAGATIKQPMRVMETLQCRKVELEAAILTEVSVMSQAEREVRAQSIRRVTLLNKKLETMSLIKPWKDFYTNRPQCKEIEGARELPCETVQHLLADLKYFLPVSKQQNPDPVQNAMDITHTDSVTGEKVVSEDRGGQQVECISAVTGGTTDNGGVPTQSDCKVFKRRNVVRIKWEGEKAPVERFVANNLIKQSMGFTPSDIFAFISLSLTSALNCPKAWRNSGLCLKPKQSPYCLRKSALHPIMFLCVYKYSAAPLQPVYNEEGFWVARWRVQVRLQVQNNVPKHLPNSFFIGKERLLFLPGPAAAVFQVWVKAPSGHKECNKIRCNLCSSLGHTYRQCPDVWHYFVKACPWWRGSSLGKK
ncbi:hypothetical protein XELAEV_18007934mg [Xenopus laevis]|uniref:CCHC-type domain-containing protein n=1 Tax=Xenopus laevis TaxID=8355 RepID=A0A974E2T6_XENLA|nr:hypothetical protein XELAEV_18007934mg [Xenopus laevis]